MTKIKRVSPENPEGILVDLTAEEEAQRLLDETRSTTTADLKSLDKEVDDIEGKVIKKV